MIIEGRWVVDDYYEDKVAEEISSLGLKPGDPVGELPDPNSSSHCNEVSALAATAASATQNKGDRSSGGIYRAGGPTTLFGGSGWGPFSDGPLNAVRKSVLSRDGVTEENWMYMMAKRVLESGDEWARWRKESVVAAGGPGAEEYAPVGPLVERAKRKTSPVKEEEEEEEGDGRSARWDRRGSARPLAEANDNKNLDDKRRDENYTNDSLGIYEPHSGLIHFRDDTQPTRCRWRTVPDPERKRHVLGGTKVGNGAWGLAWIDTLMEYGVQKGDDI